MHDEDAIYAREVTRLRAEQAQGFAVAFQGVFVEGLEVAIIVVTFAATSPSLIAWSSGGLCARYCGNAGGARATRAVLARARKQLKAIVGIMLVSLGTFGPARNSSSPGPLASIIVVFIELFRATALLAVILCASLATLKVANQAPRAHPL